MSFVSLDHLPAEVLHGKETAVLFGLSWDALGPNDNMVRLLLVPEGGGANMQAFMHRLTPLLLQGVHPSKNRHWSPDELDIQDEDLRVMHEGVSYQIANRMSASWSYFTETHAF